MANYGHVHTRRHLTREKVREVLNRVNEKYLFGLMQIEETEWAGTTTPVWVLTFKDIGDSNYSYRQCSIESKRHFEMKHGGGPDFLWWVDSLVQDAIVQEFGGKVSDDGGDGRFDSWNTPSTFKGYLHKRVSHKDSWLLRFVTYRFLLNGVSKEYMRKLRKSSKGS